MCLRSAAALCGSKLRSYAKYQFGIGGGRSAKKLGSALQPVRCLCSIVGMTDEKPPMPQMTTIPRAVVDQWLEVPHDEPLDIRLKREDLDQLFMAISKLQDAHVQLSESMIAMSFQDMGQANNYLDLSKRNFIDSRSSLNRLFTSLMASAYRAWKNKHA